MQTDSMHKTQTVCINTRDSHSIFGNTSPASDNTGIKEISVYKTTLIFSLESQRSSRKIQNLILLLLKV